MEVFSFTVGLVLSSWIGCQFMDTIYPLLLIIAHTLSLGVTLLPWISIFEECGLQFIGTFLYILSRSSCTIWQTCLHFSILITHVLFGRARDLPLETVCLEDGSFKSMLVPVILITIYVFMTLLFLKTVISLLLRMPMKKVLCYCVAAITFTLPLGMVFSPSMASEFLSTLSILPGYIFYTFIYCLSIGMKIILISIAGLMEGEGWVVLEFWKFMILEFLTLLKPFLVYIPILIPLVPLLFMIFKKLTSPVKIVDIEVNPPVLKSPTASLHEMIGLLPQIEKLDRAQKITIAKDLQMMCDSIKKECS